MKVIGVLGVAVIATSLSVGVQAKNNSGTAQIQEKLTAQIKLSAAQADGQADQTNAPAQSTPQAMQSIPPPPPPADGPPPTIALGQTKAAVIGAFGQPTKIAKLGVKEIFYYKDMKVTFTNGKVSNVE